MKWEYKSLDLGTKVFGRMDTSRLDSILNAHGDAQWELVTVVLHVRHGSLIAVFKRPKQ